MSTLVGDFAECKLLGVAVAVQASDMFLRVSFVVISLLPRKKLTVIHADELLCTY
jgi:hypothetical protein